MRSVIFSTCALVAGLLVGLTAVSAIALDHHSDKAEPSATESATPTPGPAPQWFLDEVALLTRDGGRWVASNAAYQSDTELYDFYVVEWRAGFANSMTGRLYGLTDGVPSSDFWQYRQYWRADKGEAILQQFGAGGAIGIGPLWREDGKTKMAQVFISPAGDANKLGHISHFPDPDTHVTDSYTIKDGEWTLNRSYTWKREAATPSN